MRIAVAMSGGVDSSVVAGLMAEAGHEVVGLTLRLYDGTAGRRGSCCAGRDIDDARAVADRLGFAHYVIDAQDRFRQAVIQDFADSYARGETPVPCVRCNMSVKFTDLLTLAQDVGAEALATGHYVRRVDGPDGAELHRAADPARDQSWFLFATTAAQLAYTRFPLGDMPDKATVRAHAARLGLAVADKPDSQDICFVPDRDHAALVERLRPDAAGAGEMVTADGQVVGQHAGVARYTVGQNRGLGAASFDAGIRQSVLAVDGARRRVVIGPRAAGVRQLVLRDVNWLMDAPDELACNVKLRAREAPHPVVVRCADGLVTVELPEPVLAAAGQGCVFYDGSRVLGGGFIDRS